MSRPVGYPSSKNSYGYWEVRKPDALWERVRLAKVRCRVRCVEFDKMIGACRFALLPNIGCARFRFYEGLEDGVACKHCSSTETMKYGSGKYGQRWVCKACERTFGNTGKCRGKLSGEIISEVLQLKSLELKYRAIRVIIEKHYGMRLSISTLWGIVQVAK